LTLGHGYDKFIPVAKRAKVAFSIDARLLARVEQIRLTTGESRSAVIGRALSALTSEDAHDAQVQRYLAAYRERPEGETEVEVARRQARRTLARLPWKAS
jgi:predicted transcriptional regulator